MKKIDSNKLFEENENQGTVDLETLKEDISGETIQTNEPVLIDPLQ